MSVYKAIGLMSGTSLDGLDIAYCVFTKQEGVWKYNLVQGLTIEYSKEWKKRLSESILLSAVELRKLDMEYGKLIGKLCHRYIQNNGLKIDFVASHGHTVFHQPKEGFTLQIGSGAALASELNCTVIFDFRSQDVALGGQGAPLVPIGDKLLFSDYDACVNIGGFANISLTKQEERIAWDICPANIILNPIAQKLGFDYDANGDLARKGKVDAELLNGLNQLDYYYKKAPKSLGVEWVNIEFLKYIGKQEEVDLLATLTHHIAERISADLPVSGKVLFTGGGVKNKYLIELIKAKSKAEICIPNELLIDFKEALIFAFLGVLRVNQEVNVLSSVTGAIKNHCSGSVIS